MGGIGTAATARRRPGTRGGIGHDTRFAVTARVLRAASSLATAVGLFLPLPAFPAPRAELCPALSLLTVKGVKRVIVI